MPLHSQRCYVFVRSIVVCVRCTGAAEIMPLPGSGSQAAMEHYLRPKPASSKVILITDDGERVIQSTSDDDDDAPMVAAPRSAVATMSAPSAQSHYGSGAHQVSSIQAAAPTPTIVADASASARCNRASSKRKHSDASRRSCVGFGGSGTAAAAAIVQRLTPLSFF